MAGRLTGGITIMKGLFGGLFDFNHDGKMDVFERAAEFHFLNEMMSEDDNEDSQTELEAAGLDLDELEFMDPDERREALEDAGLDPDDYDFEDSDECREELEDAGLDLDELEFMDSDERREALEDAGLDPDDYDF